MYKKNTTLKRIATGQTYVIQGIGKFVPVLGKKFLYEKTYRLKGINNPVDLIVRKSELDSLFTVLLKI